MCFSIVSMIQSVLEFRFTRAIPHSYISGNISSPCKCKERFCDSVSFGIIPSSVQKCHVLFQTIFCLLRETNGSPQPLVYFLPFEREQEVHKCIHPKHFRVSDIKSSNVMTKETSHEQILLQTMRHLRKPQINLVSL